MGLLFLEEVSLEWKLQDDDQKPKTRVRCVAQAHLVLGESRDVAAFGTTELIIVTEKSEAQREAETCLNLFW